MDLKTPPSLNRRKFLEASLKASGFLLLTPSLLSSSCTYTPPSPALPHSGQKLPDLFHRFPGFQKIPYLSLAELSASPIHALPRFSASSGIREFWIKRDDLLHPIGGGMKLRTVEFLLADALARGFKRIIAIGPIGSSLLALLAFFGKKHDLEVSALHTPQKPSLDVERILRFSANYLSNLKLVMNNPQAYLEFFLESGIGDPPSYPVYPQGMGFLGSLASICAGYELALKLRDPHLPAFEAVFLPSYSGTFALGVSAGLKLGGLDLPIHAVVVGETRLTWFSRKILKRTLSTLRILDPSFPQLPISQLKIFWERRFMGGGFGIPTMEAKSIKAVMDLSEEVPLELTYTAKCLSAVMDYHRTHPHHGPILFWNTAPPIPPDSMLKSFEGLPEAYREYFRKSARIPQDS